MPFPVARLAPSPTGAQHVGNARTFLLAWLSARSQRGRVILRIEDIDSPRVKPWAVQQAIDDLKWLGLDWDEGPDIPPVPSPPSAEERVRGPVADASRSQSNRYIQTHRLDLYRAALAELQSRELVYPCTCTRSDVEAAASAPHAGQEGPLYPGTCRHRSVADAAAVKNQPFSWRFRFLCPPCQGGGGGGNFRDAAMTFLDLHAGPQHCDVARELGDFVIAKSDGSPAYQLAVVVDDHDMGITEVVRGNDLIPSTFRQLALYDAFGWTPPQFAHVPLVIGPDGRRLAKRHGDTRLSVLRDSGVPAERLVGFLAHTCRLQPTSEPIAARELIPRFEWNRLPHEPLVFTSQMWQELISAS
uniref:Glutamyl-Q tRNA(Asp) synthetase n=1 Tax=Schlesneria paludicola TaxID=360056 RepID=A0A7C2JZM0_9PLAN